MRIRVFLEAMMIQNDLGQEIVFIMDQFTGIGDMILKAHRGLAFVILPGFSWIQ
jgi:hypothetical protein